MNELLAFVVTMSTVFLFIAGLYLVISGEFVELVTRLINKIK
jgi:hypothetical protein